MGYKPKLVSKRRPEKLLWKINVKKLLKFECKVTVDQLKTKLQWYKTKWKKW